jgi:hypothetical protein
MIATELAFSNTGLMGYGRRDYTMVRRAKAPNARQQGRAIQSIIRAGLFGTNPSTRLITAKIRNKFDQFFRDICSLNPDSP